MRRLIASEFMTLDGVMEAPGQEQHPDGKNAWALQHATEDMQRFKVEEVFADDAITAWARDLSDLGGVLAVGPS
jgi:hypothetical protein